MVAAGGLVVVQFARTQSNIGATEAYESGEDLRVASHPHPADAIYTGYEKKWSTRQACMYKRDTKLRRTWHFQLLNLIF